MPCSWTPGAAPGSGGREPGLAG